MAILLLINPLLTSGSPVLATNHPEVIGNSELEIEALDDDIMEMSESEDDTYVDDSLFEDDNQMGDMGEISESDDGFGDTLEDSEFEEESYSEGEMEDSEFAEDVSQEDEDNHWT